ncbi:MAG: transcriptional repressor [Erysipelothrix sp.]|nr:transcriptional repressor [Erysipelothrix sp.]
MHKLLLEKNNIKITQTRLDILELLSTNDQFLNAYDIKERFKSINISTIYRTLNLFDEKEIVSKRYNEELNCFTYKFIEHKHSHRLICIKCKHVFNTTFCPMEVYEQNREATHNFMITDYVFEIHGYCQACQNAMN